MPISSNLTRRARWLACDGRKVESGDIKYECHLLKDADVRAAGITLGAGARGSENLVHAGSGRAAEQGEIRSDRAGGCDPDARIGGDRHADRSRVRQGKAPIQLLAEGRGWARGREAEKSSRPYQGGISYAKVSRLAIQPGALIVEMHGAWVEPYEWYEGGGALSTKLKRGADEGIKKLREELARGPAEVRRCRRPHSDRRWSADGERYFARPLWL